MKTFWLCCKNKFLSSIPYLILLKSRCNHCRLRNTIIHNAPDTYTLCGPMCYVSSMRWYTVLESWESMKGESSRLGLANAQTFFSFLFSLRRGDKTATLAFFVYTWFCFSHAIPAKIVLLTVSSQGAIISLAGGISFGYKSQVKVLHVYKSSNAETCNCFSQEYHVFI